MNSHTMKQTKANNDDDNEIITISDEEAQKLIQSCPKIPIFSGKTELIKYQDFWYLSHIPTFKSILAFQRHFHARDTDLILSSHPKTGTTWLKSLLYAIVNRTNYTPLLEKHPHELVLRLEVDIYGLAFEYPRPHHLEEIPSPRLFSTHLPYLSLPESVQTTRCKVVYIARNPLDTCVSQWHFRRKVLRKMLKDDDVESYSFSEYFEDFYQGRIYHGPFFEHLLGYWKLSLEQPDKVLFLKYEDVKNDGVNVLKRLAEFVDQPFSQEEEQQGLIEQIVKLCSIGNLKEVDANKSGVFNKYFEKSSYFRKGEIGDWSHYFTSFQLERMKSLMEEKLKDSGLSFQLLPS